MSVLKNKRGLSDLEFYRNGIVLRKNLTELLLRDFGIRNKIRKSVAYTKNMAEEDAGIFQGLIDKYECTDIIAEFPKWIIDNMRTNILNLCHSMIMNITQANTIYPTNEAEYYDRRNYQNHAIGNCEQLLQEMQYIISIIPVDANKFMPYTKMITKEIQLLKGWRKSDNRILKSIQGKQNKNKDTVSNKNENNRDNA